MSLQQQCHERNPKLFLWFRVLFNSRFYYPVFSILFFDFGMSPEQFAILNLVWALSIIVFEVPSGALADRIGRKPLIVLSSFLMILEMLVLLVVDIGGPWVFSAFLVNRVLSGFAEAAASGADEALVYDSLSEKNKEEEWAALLSKLMKWSAVGFLFVSIVGGLVYDPNLMTKLLGFFSIDKQLTVKETVKLPIFLTMLGGVACLISSLLMIEAPHQKSKEGIWASIKNSFVGIAETAKWITQTKVMWILLLLGVVLDSAVRLFLTVSSDYYRIVHIPEAYFGLISAASSLAGMATAGLMEKMLKKKSADYNFVFLAAMIFLSFVGITFKIPYWGILFVLPFALGMRFLQFFLSYYINRVTHSSRRATALSFKGLAMNLGYGALNIGYALQARYLKTQGVDREEQLGAAIQIWPWVFLIFLILFAIIYRTATRKSLNQLLESKA